MASSRCPKRQEIVGEVLAHRQPAAATALPQPQLDHPPALLADPLQRRHPFGRIRLGLPVSLPALLVSVMILKPLRRHRPGTARTFPGRPAHRPAPGGAPALAQAMYWPPLALSVEPVMNPASSLAKNATQRAISSGSPSRPTGICGRILALSTSAGTALTISVAM